MTLPILAFLLGVAAVQQLRVLPGLWELGLLALLATILAWKRYWLPVFFLLALLWACLIGQWRLADSLSPDAQLRPYIIEGYINSLPEKKPDKIGFDFIVRYPAKNFPTKLHLSWYQPSHTLQTGQIWRFSVKLKQPYGYLNPGGFNYEAWLYANHIGATGSVSNLPAPELLGEQAGIGIWFAELRQTIAARLEQALPQHPQLGLIKALSIGSQDGISAAQWQVFKDTGTTHLVVISGSHISLVAGLVFLAARRGWARLGILRISPPRAAAGCAWLAGLAYAGLAGYSVPTLRAVIMLSVAMAAIAWQRHTSIWQIWLLALLAVLIVDPPVVLAAGFWLSFCAVAILIYISVGRLGRPGFWQAATLPQLAAALGLAPLLLVFFQQLALISPVANWLAVPVIGLLAVPLALMAVLLLFLWPTLAGYLLQVTGWLLDGLWQILEKLAALPWANVYCLTPPWYAVLLAIPGILLLLAPRGIPGRYLGGILLLPLGLVNNAVPQPGNVWLTLLDVGQGLSVVAQTSTHTLVFDTGAQFSPELDMGSAVIAPFLREQGLNTIQTLIVSHDDKDHSGGAPALLQQIPAMQILSSARRWAEAPGGFYCRADQSWQWDQVQFRMLSPPSQAFSKENNNSCVLQISAGADSFLLTGDIETPAENWLTEQYGPQLRSTMLIAPHHGSKTSSSYDFLAAVAPQWVLIPAGHLNRFGFPHQQVLNNYRLLNLPWLNTAEQGAISIRTHSGVLQIETAWQQQQRYWMTDRNSIELSADIE